MGIGRIGIIADGNRRWSDRSGVDISIGYLQACYKFEQICEWALKNELQSVCIYAFSTHNWRRDKQELDVLFTTAHGYFESRLWWYAEHEIKVVFVGRRDRFSKGLLDAIKETEEKTKELDKLTLYVCTDYSGREQVVEACIKCAKNNNGEITTEEVNEIIESELPSVDLIMRTGGRHRLSDFMLWQAEFSEICFTDVLFPDINDELLDEAWENQKNSIKNFGK